MATIVWDRDDVLNDLLRCWLEDWWKPGHPDCTTAYEDLTENPPHRVIGIRLEEYLESLDAFRLSTLADAMDPLPDVLLWFERHGGDHRHLVLSSTPVATAATAAAWTFRHFGRWVDSFHLVPSPRASDRAPSRYGDKGEYLHWLAKGDAFVDDSPAHVESARRAGLDGVLFPRPWNGAPGTIAETLARMTERLAIT